LQTKRQDAAISVAQPGWLKMSTQTSQFRTTIRIPWEHSVHE
jgi:hypothetical protein